MPEATILFICTGNLCRSPSAAALLERRLAAVGPSGVVVHSAGTIRAAGGPPEELVAAGRDYGVELADHQPRRMTATNVTKADLIVGMSREHVREVVVLNPDVFGCTFTLRELVRRAVPIGPRSTGQPIGEWLAEVHGDRRHLDLVGPFAADDIADPMGGRPEDYRQMLADVAGLVDSLHGLVWGAGRGEAGVGFE